MFICIEKIKSYDLKFHAEKMKELRVSVESSIDGTTNDESLQLIELLVDDLESMEFLRVNWKLLELLECPSLQSI